MEGIYKTKIRETELADLVRKTLGGRLTKSREMTGGWANSAYALELEDGMRAVLKAGPPKSARMMRYEVRIMKTEVEAMRLLASSPLPVPQVYHYDDTCTELPVEFFIMEHMDGEIYGSVKPSLSEAERETIDAELGRLNRILNEVRGQRFGLYAQPSDAGWKDTFMDLIFGVLLDGEEMGVVLPVPYAEIRGEVLARSEVLDEVKEPRLVHWDLWDGNVFVKDGAVTGLIDFERALWGDPLMEVYFSHFNRSPAFLRGYGKSKLSESEFARRSLYDLYLDLILYVECTFRQYDDEGHIRWARDNLAEGLARFMNGQHR
ncbi:phosphotransferase family protein [Cohnella candidum]|uniref:phosphotransferase family protein n=1 Tax=Cohnella candidum TaxID=2674991 RepID=UPI0013DDB2AB|nr:phosphotransferase [Cohnella candidum]